MATRNIRFARTAFKSMCGVLLLVGVGGCGIDQRSSPDDSDASVLLRRGAPRLRRGISFTW